MVAMFNNLRFERLDRFVAPREGIPRISPQTRAGLRRLLNENREKGGEQKDTSTQAWRLLVTLSTQCEAFRRQQ